VGRHSVGWVNCVRSCDTMHYYCSGCCSVGSWCLYVRCSCLFVAVGIGGVVVGSMGCVGEVVSSSGAGVSVCSTLCWWAVNVGFGFMVVCVG
jgi:hypothetical protein